MWLYYQIYAKAKDDPKKCKHSDIAPLENYLHQRPRNTDAQRATHLMEEFVGQFYRSHSPDRGFGILDQLFNGSGRNESDPIEPEFGIRLIQKG